MTRFYKIIRNLSLIVLFFYVVLPASAEKSDSTDQKDVPIEVNADNVEYIKENEVVKGKGNVVINFKGVKLSADEMTVNLKTKDVYADGNVRFYQAERLYTAEHAYYNFDTEKGRFENTKGLFKPFYVYGQVINKTENKAEYHIDNGFITTSDYSLPDYRLRAESVHVYPKEKVVLKNIVFEIGGIPVFWFPYWCYFISDKDAPFSSTPGYSKKMGAYLLNSAQIYRSEYMKIQASLDLRSKRGVAGGLDAEYDYDGKIKGMVKSYLMRDYGYSEYDEKLDGSRTVRDYDKNRYRVTWEHEQQITPDTRFLAEFNMQSDKQIIDDFFHREFQNQMQRTNFIDLTRAAENYQFEFYASPRFNSFFDVLERMPEISLTSRNRQIFDSGFFHESDIRMSNLRFKFDQDIYNYDVTRFTSFHRFSRPFYLWDFLNINPYIEVRSVMYSDVRQKHTKSRGVFSAGVDSSFRLSKIYDVNSENWNIHGIRHIIEPKIDFKMIRTSMRAERVYQFDSVDSIVHDTYIAVDIRNLFQTRRFKEKVETNSIGKDKVFTRKGMETVTTDLVDFSIKFDIYPSGADRDTFPVGHINSDYAALTLLDFFFRRNIVIGSPYVGSKRGKWISDLLFEMKFSPYDWLNTSVSVRYDPHDSQLEEIAFGFSILHTDKLSWDVYTSFYLGGSTQLNHTLSYRINDDWRIRVSHVLDFNRTGDDGGLVESQRYTLIKDLHEWEMAFSYGDKRYSRLSEEIDRSFMVMFYLKDFPEIRLKLGN